jgi:hypothetical protein
LRIRLFRTVQALRVVGFNHLQLPGMRAHREAPDRVMRQPSWDEYTAYEAEHPFFNGQTTASVTVRDLEYHVRVLPACQRG